MSQSHDDAQRVWSLIQSDIDGTLTPDDAQQLEQALLKNDDHVHLYLDYLRLHSELSLWRRESRSLETTLAVVQEAVEAVSHTTTAFPDIEVKPASLSRRHHRYDSIHWERHKVRFNAMTAVLTALAWVGFSFFVWLTTTPDDSRPQRQDEDFNFVAYISGRYEHQWAEEMRAMPPNASMPVGERLLLDEGLIEITFFDGAVVVLEGPSEFVVDSRGAGTLEVGKLTARVSEEAVGFVVRTPHATVVDHGTEFGVEVRDELVDVTVFIGEVEMITHRQGTQPGRRVRLTAGRAAQLSPATGRIVLRAAEETSVAYRRVLPAYDHFGTTNTAQGTLITSMSASAPTTNVAISQTANESGNPSTPWRTESGLRQAGQTFFIDGTIFPAGFTLDAITVNIASISNADLNGDSFTLTINTYSNGADFTPDSTVATEVGTLPANMFAAVGSGNTYLTLDITDVILSGGVQYGFFLDPTGFSDTANFLLEAKMNSLYTDGIGTEEGPAEMTQWDGGLLQLSDLEFYLQGHAVPQPESAPRITTNREGQGVVSTMQ